MSGFHLHVRATPRERLPAHLSVGEHLVGLVRASLASESRDPAAVVVVREHAVELLDPRPALATGMPLPWLLAGLTSSPALSGRVEAVGLAGRLTLRRGSESKPVSVATVFLEWADNSWWHWQVRLDAHGQAIAGTEQVRSAEAGFGMPAGLGRWWSTGRRKGVRLSMAPLASAGDGGIEH